MTVEMNLKSVEKPDNNEEVFEYFIEDDDERYISITVQRSRTQSSEDLPGLYRAEWETDIDENSFREVVIRNLPTDEMLADRYVPEKFLNVEREGVRAGGTTEEMYVEFPQVPYHDQSEPYHNLSFNTGEKSLSLEVRDSSVEPLKKWFQASRDVNEEKAETIADKVKKTVDKHLEQGS